MRASEVRATLEDLMYMSILEKFVLLGVPMLPRLEGASQCVCVWGGECSASVRLGVCA